MNCFEPIAPVRYEGPHTGNALAYRHYDRQALVLGKSMEDHLRLAVCYWAAAFLGGCAGAGATPIGMSTISPGTITTFAATSRGGVLASWAQ